MTTDLKALRQSAEKILGLRQEAYLWPIRGKQACDTLAAMLPLIDRCERLEAALRTIASGTADSAPPYRGLGTSGPVRDIAVAALATPPEDANHDKT